MKREILLTANEIVLEIKCTTPKCPIVMVFDPRVTNGQARNLCPGCGNQSFEIAGIADAWRVLSKYENLTLRIQDPAIQDKAA